MQIIHSLTLYAVFGLPVFDAASLLFQEPKKSLSTLSLGSDLSKSSSFGSKFMNMFAKNSSNPASSAKMSEMALSTSSNSSLSSASISSTPADTSASSKVAKFVKDVTGRRRVSFVGWDSAWQGVPSLLGSPGYVVRFYRSGHNESYKEAQLVFPSNPHTFDSNRTRVLIQAESEDNKRLCIFTQDPLQDHVENLERLVKEMIAAGKDESRHTEIFSRYRKSLGLPDHAKPFSYMVYAWKTDSDCAFYNLGAPTHLAQIYQNPLQAETEIASESVADKTFTIQLSQAHVSNHLPINVFFMNRYSETTPAGTQFRIRPIQRDYESLNSLYDDLKKQAPIQKLIETSFDGEYCVTQFNLNAQRMTDIAGEPLTPSSEPSKITLAENLHQNFLRYYARDIQNGMDDIKKKRSEYIKSLVGPFRNFADGADTVIVATWKPIEGSCNFPSKAE